MEARFFIMICTDRTEHECIRYKRSDDGSEKGMVLL